MNKSEGPMEKRFHTRYPLNCECIVAFESGLNFYADILDISLEGAQLRVDRPIPLKLGDILYINIKCTYKIKVKAQVRWLSQEKYTYCGVKFIELSMKDRESLSKLISEMALSTLSDAYL